jgi:DMSO/TMAO reductase YedYZ heme-binding membrane subunit
MKKSYDILQQSEMNLKNALAIYAKNYTYPHNYEQINIDKNDCTPGEN